MKKLFVLTVATVLFASPSAFADDHEAGKRDKGAMFEKHDTNGDGSISKAEFLSHAEERFAKMDADGNGEITKDEAQAKKAEWKEKMKERREKRMEKEGETQAE